MISVLTCAARGQYLAQTIASIDRGGGASSHGLDKVIHVDGPADGIGPFEGWRVQSLSPARGGAKRAMFDILARALAAGADPLLYFEDDVLICKNTIQAMLEIGVPEPLGFVSYCDLLWHPTEPLELAAFPGCPHNAPVADGGFVGCQALAISRRTIERLLTTPPPVWIDRNNCDATIGTSSAIYGVVDSLANHIGVDSCIMGRPYGRLRVVRGWRGEDFDADAVPRTFELGDVGERCPFHAGVLHETRRACDASTEQHAAFKAAPAVDV
jgi:hypothetical protein